MIGSQYSSSLFQRYGFTTVLAFVFLLLSVAVISNLQLQDTRALLTESAELKINTHYLADQGSTLSIDEVSAKQSQFISADADDIPYQLGDVTYWVAFTLKNNIDSKQSLVLHIDNTMLETLEAFHWNVNDWQAMSKISLSATAFPRLTLDVPAFSQQQVLLKLKAGGPPNIPLVWYQADKYQQKELLTLLLFGVVIGVLVIMALYNLVIYAAIKDKVYLIYIGYLLSAFLVLATVNGFGFLIFESKLQILFNQYLLFFHYYLVAFLILFTLYFLKYNEQKGWLFTLGKYCVVLFIMLSFATQWLPHELQATIFFSLSPLIYLYSILLILLRVKKQFSWSRFYLLSWIPLLLGAAVQPLVLLNLLEYSFLTRNAFMIAVVIEVVFMAFALAERMRRHEVERIAEISYHPSTGMARKILIETTIAQLIKQPNAKFSVVVIKPEHIERIALYVNDVMNTTLFARMYKKLIPLFAYNDAVVEIGVNGEKLAFISGNSLCFILNEQTNNQPIETIIQSINTLVEEAYQIDELDIPLKATIGIAHYPEHGTEPFILLNRAQLALQQAELKHCRWSYFIENQSDTTGHRLQLACDLNEALANDELALYHQPQIDLKTMRVCGSECLIRWHHHTQGLIPPDVFIPVAEDMGLINKVTQWVIRQAIAQHSVLLSQGYKHHKVSINISGKDIAADNFYDDVLTELKEAEFPANKLVFELTESATITNDEQALKTIEMLTELGITVSIDDFGTGYSSMAYISQLPFQELKVDRQFVENVCDDAKRKTIAQTTVKMAKGLGLEVVAEGINSQLDEDALRQFGCDIGQGYFYAKPMAFDEYINWLADEINGRPPQPLEGEFIPKAN